MREHVRITILLFAGFTVGAAAPAPAQDISARSLDLELGGRLQTQIVHSSVSDGPGVEAILRRARISVDGRLNEWVDGRLQIDQGGVLKDAYARITFSPSFRVSAGKFKRAFDLFELQSSADINVERDGRIPGLAACAGIGGVCSWSGLTETLDYSGRDVGVRMAGSVGDRWTYMATVTNGTGVDSDTNDTKSTAGRVTVDVEENITVGGNVSVRDYTLFGSNEFATAWGVDLEIGAFETPGFHLQSGFMGGDNWALDSGDGPTTFVSAQGILSWYVDSEDVGPVVGVEPLVRVSASDPDTDSPDDGALLFTPGFWTHFGARNKVGATIDVYSQDAVDSEFSLKVFTHLYF